MVDPSTTHALLIGIEQYNDGVNPLDAPANDVYRFAQWLLDRKVPKDNISVLLSPLEQNKKIAQDIAALLGKTSLPAATRGKVDQAFEQLKETQASLFLMLWGGHGWVTALGDRRLFYADATRQSYKNLDLSQQLTAMRSTLYKGISEQVIIVDACANSYKLKEGELPHDQPALGDPLPKLSQFVMFAASSGEYAENKGIEKAGLFSDEVLKQVNSLPAETWPPDMKVIMNSVQQEFEELRVKGQSQQTPAYTLYIVNGNAESFVLQPKSEVDGVQTSSVVLKRFQDLTPAEAELRTRFLACPSINDSATRRSIVQQLRYGIANEFNQGGDARDVMDLIKICLSYPHGVDELLYLMNFYERNSDEIKALRENVARITQKEPSNQPELDVRELSFMQLNALSRKLLACPALDDELLRNGIIDELERETTITKGSIRHGAGLQPLQIIEDILKKCRSYSGSFKVFLEMLRDRDGSTVEFVEVEELIKELIAQN